MKFGGTSVADAERIRAVREIVEQRREERPVVVVSALAGVTDLLETAIGAARRDERERLEPILADLERRHRWAVSGCIGDGDRRHRLDVELDGRFAELRQLLRAIRILGEETPRACDVLLSFGESLSATLIASSFLDAGLPASQVDARDVIVTDRRFGAAEPDLELTRERARKVLLPEIEAGRVPVMGGFVGASTDGETTTLGRGGSDTSATVLGAVLDADEIQVWTDVDGLMTADPRWVPEARTLAGVSYEEAADLAFFGARVLHPASIAPAASRGIPLRVLNTLRPSGPGTRVGEPPEDTRPVAAVAIRDGVRTIRVANTGLRSEPDFVAQVLRSVASSGATPDLMVSSEVAVTLVLRDDRQRAPFRFDFDERFSVEEVAGLALVCVVGAGLARDPGCRSRVVAALAEWEPELIAMGVTGHMATAVLPSERMGDAVRGIHRRFFEESEVP